MTALNMPITQDYALTSLNQIGCRSETAPTRARGISLWPVVIRLGAIPKLPLHNCDQSRLATPQADWVDRAFRNGPNWKSLNTIKVLRPMTSLGGETHPLRGWWRTPQAGSPTSTPRGFRAASRPSAPSITTQDPKGPLTMTAPQTVGRASAPVQSPTTPQGMLALDLGTTTGWAMKLPDGSVVSGTMSFRPRRYEGGGMG